MVQTFAVTLTLDSDLEVEALVETEFDAWKDYNGRKDVWDWQVLNLTAWVDGRVIVLRKNEKNRLDKLIEKKMKSVDFKEHYSEISIA